MLSSWLNKKANRSVKLRIKWLWILELEIVFKVIIYISFQFNCVREVVITNATIVSPRDNHWHWRRWMGWLKSEEKCRWIISFKITHSIHNITATKRWRINSGCLKLILYFHLANINMNYVFWYPLPCFHSIHHIRQMDSIMHHIAFTDASWTVKFDGRYKDSESMLVFEIN